MENSTTTTLDRHSIRDELNEPLEYFPLSDIRVKSATFHEAMETDKAYLLRLEPDRFLSWFRKEAGLEPKGEVYGGWESQGVAGQTLGHYLSALSLMYQATGDLEMRRRADYIVDELAQCQRANGNGYIGATPRGKEIYAEIAAGQIEIKGGFSLNDGWVPVYVLHKVFAGLLDAYHRCGNEQALEAVLALTEWCQSVFGHLSHQQMQEVLFVEHGGMAESLAEVYAITKDPRHLEFARRWRHDEFFLPILNGEDKLDGRHANTQIPKFIGYQRLHELTGEPEWGQAARNFWNFVARDRSFAIGGNSVGEHFFPVDQFEKTMRQGVGPETCNTYNMLKLTRRLFAERPSAELIALYERALWNHILTSQHPKTGGFVYYTGVRPGSFRNYSSDCDCFWCCVGTGMENHAKYGETIYAHRKDSLFVNLFIASELNWKDQNAIVEQETNFPFEPRTTLRFRLVAPREFSVSIRYPKWVEAGALQLAINGQNQPVEAGPGEYVQVNREWRDGDVLSVELPMQIKMEFLPGSKNYAAFMYGPIVMAGTHGKEDLRDKDAYAQSLRATPLFEQASLVVPVDEIAGHLEAVPDRPLHFVSHGLTKPNDIKLVPFYGVHDERYTIYWPLFKDEAAWKAGQQMLAEQAMREAELQRRTIDAVAAGQQQSEVDHEMQGEKTHTGYHGDKSWRNAREEGWFAYRMKVEQDVPLELYCTYWSGDDVRDFDIFVDDILLVREHNEPRYPGEFFEKAYPIPPEMTAEKNSVVVKWQPKPGSIAGIYSCRIVRQ